MKIISRNIISIAIISISYLCTQATKYTFLATRVFNGVITRYRGAMAARKSNERKKELHFSSRRTRSFLCGLGRCKTRADLKSVSIKVSGAQVWFYCRACCCVTARRVSLQRAAGFLRLWEGRCRPCHDPNDGLLGRMNKSALPCDYSWNP